MSPPNLYVEVVTPVPQNKTLLRDRVFIELTKLKQDHYGWVPTATTGLLIKRGHFDMEPPSQGDVETKTQVNEGDAPTSQGMPKTASKPPEASGEA